MISYFISHLILVFVLPKIYDLYARQQSKFSWLKAKHNFGLSRAKLYKPWGMLN